MFFQHSLAYRRIGSAHILWPSPESRIEMRGRAEAHLRKRYSPGSYTEGKICNDILQYMFSFYDMQLNVLLPLVATSRWVGELLFQYEESGRVSREHKLNTLSQGDQDVWTRMGPTYRQALDLACEKLVALRNIDNVSRLWQTQIPEFEKVIICAEKCVEYASLSNYTHMVVPAATTVDIHPPGSDPYFEHTIGSAVDHQIKAYMKQNHHEITSRKHYLDNTFDPFSHQYHARLLNEPLRKAIGVNYEEFLGLVSIAPGSFKPPNSYKEVPMVEKGMLLEEVQEIMGIPSETIANIFDMLTLDPAREREVWNSRQRNRVNKRPFLEFVSNGRIVLTWSGQKVNDFLSLLDSDLTFNNPPEGWKKSSALVSAVTGISNEAGKWFERSATAQLKKLGIQGFRIENKAFDNFPQVRFDCGEIDYLGYDADTNSIMLFEFKMFETGFDVRGVRQARSAFMEHDDAYTKVLAKKRKWIMDHSDDVKVLLKARLSIDIPADARLTGHAFITYYPSLMNLFFTDPPCKSLAEFVEDYRRAGKWPYSSG